MSDIQDAQDIFKAHISAATQLHEAQVNMLKLNQTILKLTEKLELAKEVAIEATADIEKKRRAAILAEESFASCVRNTRSKASHFPEPESPGYSPTAPYYARLRAQASTAAKKDSEGAKGDEWDNDDSD